MAYVVRMPKLGVEMETGVVTAWHVGVSDPIEDGEVVVEVESEKTSAEVTAREKGILRRIYMTEGDEGAPGTPMGIIGGPQEDISALIEEVDTDAVEAVSNGTRTTVDGPTARDRSSGDDTTGGSPTEGDSVTVDDGRIKEQEAQKTGDGQAEGRTTVADANPPKTPEGRIKATPKAKRRAEDLGVSLVTLRGSGPSGAIVAADVEAAVDDPEGSDSERVRTVREQRELTPMRQTIADRLGRSRREIPHVTVDREVEVEAAIEATNRADQAADGEVSFIDMVLAAVSATLTEYPSFNAAYDADAEHHILYEEHNLGVAVDIEGGLLTPVIPDIRGQPPRELAGTRRRLVNRALSGDHDADDLSGGTFTVSNLGALGSDSFTPILNPPEVAILGVNRIRERPVNTRNGIEFCRHVTFSLSFDHRVVDGGDAARFLSTLEEYLAEADTFLADEPCNRNSSP